MVRRLTKVTLALMALGFSGAAVEWLVRPKPPAVAFDFGLENAAEIVSSAVDDKPPPPPPRDEAADDESETTLDGQRAVLYRRMLANLDVTDEQVAEVREIFEASPVIGQGNPAPTKHPMTRAACRKIRKDAGLTIEPHPPCDRKNMVPLYDPTAGETAKDAKACIDQFEFPDIPCDYPVVYGRAREAALLCKAVGKRICDAHEWEGACAGAVRSPEVDYAWGNPRPYATWLHNKEREIIWSYGPEKNHLMCATQSRKSPACIAGGWTLCGSNTYPAGSFPTCVSPLGAYDLNGNAAEHMNLPLEPDELASRGGTGATEMKGSWFIFYREEAHEDDCRWRAKDWHPSKLMAEDSHRNYHLGFRCCADVVHDADAGGPDAEVKAPE